MFLMICHLNSIGNPGLDTYYEYFMEILEKRFCNDKKPDIVCISYAGHINPHTSEVGTI